MDGKRSRAPITALVIIVILAIVAIIAVPAWRKHQVSNRVDTAMRAVDSAKLVVMEAAATHGGLSDIKARDLGYNSTNSANPYVARVDIGDGGSITLTTRNTGTSPDPVLRLTPFSDKTDKALVHWQCSVVAGDASVAPANCRGTQPAIKPDTPQPAATNAKNVSD